MKLCKRLLRSLLTGGAATAVDLIVLALCIYALGMTARLASFPALGAGALIQFFGNRHFAFQAAHGCVKRQAFRFGVTEVITLGLNALVYDRLVATFVYTNEAALFARIISTNAVFVLWSFPVWHWVFRTRAEKGRVAFSPRPQRTQG